MILYYKPTCPYCIKVLQFAEQKGITLTLKNVAESDELRNELIATGGKKQVPFLVDEAAGVQMYESDDIIRYLGGDAPESTGNTCPVQL